MVQENAVGKVKAFMGAIIEVNRIQAWWRMLRIRRHFHQFRAEQLAFIGLWFHAWRYEIHMVERMRIFLICGKPFHAWKAETEELRRLARLGLEFFKISVRRSRLSAQAVTAFFDPGRWEAHVNPADMHKIRRLILANIFNGWCNESKSLRTRRFQVFH